MFIQKYEQMRSGVNLKRPVLLGGSKFLLRIFIQETLRFPNPSANILNTQKGVVNTTHFFYGDNIKIRITWECRKPTQELFLKVLFSNTARGIVGGGFLGTLQYVDGMNYADIVIDTQYFVPGSYIPNFKLYSQDGQGIVVTHDTCEALCFTIEHSEKSVHLREWYNNWGSAILPCLSYGEEIK